MRCLIDAKTKTGNRLAQFALAVSVIGLGSSPGVVTFYSVRES